MTRAAAGTERELKLGVWPEFELPDLGRALKRGTMGPMVERRLKAVYYDTPDLRLLRRGVTLRFRRGEDVGPLWTAKLPEAAPALGLSRREISLPGKPGPVPQLLRDVTRGWALGARLERVAQIVTTRRSVPLIDAAGTAVASIDDDDVAVFRGRRVAARFRELEVELAERARPELLAALAKRLRSAGAQPVPQVPKLVHALGPAATEPWDFAVPELGPRPSAAEVLRRRVLQAAGPGLVDHHAAIVLDESTGALRNACRAVRQLAADLRAAGPLIDPEAGGPLFEELVWLAGELGRLEGAGERIARLSDDAASAARPMVPRRVPNDLVSNLAADRARQHERLLGSLRGRGYRALLGRVATLASPSAPWSRKARRRAAAVTPPLVQHALRDLRHEVAGAPDPPDDRTMDRLEWPVESLSSAIELAAPFSGPPAARAARQAEQLRALLGEHRQAMESARALRAAAAGADAGTSWAAGLFAGVYIERAARCRKQLPGVWHRVARKRRWTWLD